MLKKAKNGLKSRWNSSNWAEKKKKKVHKFEQTKKKKLKSAEKLKSFRSELTMWVPPNSFEVPFHIDIKPLYMLISKYVNDDLQF